MSGPTTAAEAECKHRNVLRFASIVGEGVDSATTLWACEDCRLRFYPHGAVLRGLSDGDRAAAVVEWLRSEHGLTTLASALATVDWDTWDADSQWLGHAKALRHELLGMFGE